MGLPISPTHPAPLLHLLVLALGLGLWSGQKQCGSDMFILGLRPDISPGSGIRLVIPLHSAGAGDQSVAPRLGSFSSFPGEARGFVFMTCSPFPVGGEYGARLGLVSCRWSVCCSSIVFPPLVC